MGCLEYKTVQAANQMVSRLAIQNFGLDGYPTKTAYGYIKGIALNWKKFPGETW